MLQGLVEGWWLAIELAVGAEGIEIDAFAWIKLTENSSPVSGYIDTSAAFKFPDQWVVMQ